MSDKGITLEGLAAAVDALREELATWKALAHKQDALTAAQITATQSGATAAKIDQIAVNTAAIQALSAQVAGQISLEYVTALPATGEPFTLYLVPQGDGTAPNYCNEYLWINGDWELIGTTGSMANNGELTIQVNGVAVGTFTANQAANSAINVTVPTNTNQLVNGAQYVDAASLATALALKQNNLNAAQLDAVNSGITAALVTQIGANATAIAGKQDALTTAQQAAVDSGATAAKIDQIASNAAAIVSLTSSKQDALSTAQLAAVNSGITSAAVAQISTNTTALASKAADNAVVHLAGAETIPGNKTFTGAVVTHTVAPETTGTYALGTNARRWNGIYDANGVFVYNNAYTFGTAPSTNRFWGLWNRDSTGVEVVDFLACAYSSGSNSATLRCLNTDGTNTYDRRLELVVSQNGSTTVKPYHNVEYDLGNSTSQWKSVYAQTYYYNGTAWGLDKANTWTGVNTFGVEPAGSTSVKHTTYKGAILFRTNGVSNFKNYNTFFKWDINGFDNTFGLYRSLGILGDTTTGATDEDIDTSFSLWKAHIRSKSLDFTDSVKVTNDGTENSLKPITTSVTDLGTSTNKWKTLNGINPGALGMIDTSTYVDIDTSTWASDGVVANRVYINGANPDFPGYLFIRAAGSNTDLLAVRLAGATADRPLWTAPYYPGGGGLLHVIVPCPANTPIRVYTSVTPAVCKYFACLGNV